MLNPSISAPGKIILFGEHAVVYGTPAIAVPVHQVQATCTITTTPPGSGLRIEAPDLQKAYWLTEAPHDDPLAVVVRHTLTTLGRPAPDLTLSVSSSIPIACGLGSGAAISTVLVSALAAALDRPLTTQQISDIVFEVEKIYHGTPSGIDNTVIAFGQPVYFVKGQPIQRLNVGQPFTVVIGDTGLKSPTYKVVGDLGQRRQANPPWFDARFERIASIARQARYAIEHGDWPALGPLMTQNQAILVELGLSAPRLDCLVSAAISAGALGAKLSGAGWGGNMIALVEPPQAEIVSAALQQAGAKQTIVTTVAKLQR